MEKVERYILMHQNDEILSFEATFGECNGVRVIEWLGHFEKAPFGIKKESDEEEANTALFHFLIKRTIAETRWDYPDILKYTNARDAYELSFKGHGLSLSNHYWYKKEGEDLRYEDINFFTNKWDDGFARAVLRGDYQSLQNVSLNVPDIVTCGWGVKGWLCEEDGPRLYKMGIAKDQYEETLAEVLCSDLAKRMFKNNDFWEYQLREIYGKYASASKVIIGIDEELIPLSVIIPNDISALYRIKNQDRTADEEFFARLSKINIPGIYERFVKLACWRSLCFANDLHFDNLSAIRNNKTGKIRLAPVFDFGGAFGSGKTGKGFLSHINAGTYLLVYFSFGGLNPDWDYSWYDGERLNGFEEDIREMLSKSDFYTPELIDNIIGVYLYQKATLDELAQGKK